MKYLKEWLFLLLPNSSNTTFKPSVTFFDSNFLHLNPLIHCFFYSQLFLPSPFSHSGYESHYCSLWVHFLLIGNLLSTMAFATMFIAIPSLAWEPLSLSPSRLGNLIIHSYMSCIMNHSMLNCWLWNRLWQISSRSGGWTQNCSHCWTPRV